ncbi:hypothetical protein [Arthrobacter sp. FW306-04-A]|uniref:hypothetical protein n=1 Tax=Arthrobacter sp. FW306-04-A TaxID=2879619 RepID=UPI0037BEFA74|nr:hypothetical protein LFT43_08985 [Arthrobacter sp. FW306-04-A]
MINVAPGCVRGIAILRGRGPETKLHCIQFRGYGCRAERPTTAIADIRERTTAGPARRAVKILAFLRRRKVGLDSGGNP